MPRNSVASTTPKIPVKSQPIQAPLANRSIFSAMQDGLGFGIGQAIAMRAFGIGSSVIKGNNETSGVPVKKVNNESPEFVQCMKESNNDREVCSTMHPTQTI